MNSDDIAALAALGAELRAQFELEVAIEREKILGLGLPIEWHDDRHGGHYCMDQGTWQELRRQFPPREQSYAPTYVPTLPGTPVFVDGCPNIIEQLTVEGPDDRH